MSDYTDETVEELDALFAATRTTRGTTARMESLSPTMRLLVEDYAEHFLTTAKSLTTGKPLSKNSRDSYKSGIVSALLKNRRGEKLSSDENSYTRMFERYINELAEFNDEPDDES